ncbi:hypothetical protein BpHYR1_037534 [Brachionus plicatilis]|uniref:Tc1-like transposase DDE domain-containing protein n=1 Tax=Brachionus plicatilis TaxID=10195 RepID=A0A3M7S011_BRAPC|nr:hypothetical protein BpHYR1_037534 [Brachionus plicatilis]
MTRLNLKNSFLKNILPSIGYIQKLISNSRKKKNRTIERKGLESSTKISKIVENEFGFRCRRLSNAPNLTELHKLACLIWCLRHKNCDFDDYVFVDETSIIVYDKPSYQLRLFSSQPEAIPCTSKFKSKIHIWGGISRKGITEFAVKAPAYSPDLNPIEMVWNELIRFIRANDPQNDEELTNIKFDLKLTSILMFDELNERCSLRERDRPVHEISLYLKSINEIKFLLDKI